jgi:hypothetical protein
MATFYKQECPLCGSAAEYCWVDGHNRKYFDCPKCTHFQISKRAGGVLATKSQHRRDSYAASAPTAPADHLLVILVPSHEFRQQCNDDLQASFVPKVELSLNCE